MGQGDPRVLEISRTRGLQDCIDARHFERLMPETYLHFLGCEAGCRSVF